MRRIWLQFNDYVTLVDSSDHEMLLKHGTWYWDGRYVKHKKNGKRHGPDLPRDPAVVTYMHRLIMNTPVGYDIDHINGNPLDNRKANLRVCTRSQNNQNRMTIGVYWSHQRQQYFAKLMKERKTHTRGYFDNYEEAVNAYFSLIEEHFADYSDRRYAQSV